jgi:flavin reductase (DIM6/NTAB) family NADH-FMN oxidoreductase RutF
MKTSLGPKTTACPLPVWCIGTYDSEGKPNVMTASWAGICCSRPPAVAVSLRKATYTYRSIVDSKAFTVNVPSAKHAKIADYIGIASGKNVDKFAAAGLTPVKSEVVNAPFVLEFPLILECTLLHIIEIGLHTQFIGEIMDVKADVEVLSEDGEVDAAKIDTFFFSPADRVYYGTGPIVGKAFSIGKDLPGESR